MTLAGVFYVGMISASHALPSNGNVVGGSASITTNSNKTTIDQISQRAVINWGSFNVNSGQTVQFEQPSSSAIALNRVMDSGTSQIDGQLLANGNVWILNPNGVVFGKHAQVNVGGLLATSSAIDDDDFMAGNYNFTPGNNPNATVSNSGNITVGNAGLAAFVAPNVTNSGIIQAKLGSVSLASGDSYTVDMYGDGLINLQVSGSVKSQLVSNSGTIAAEGGTVNLSTAAASSIVNNLINMDGLIEADTVDGKTGNVAIRSGGAASISGTIEARGGAAGGDGGFVETSAKTLAFTGHVNASAPAGNAGTWLLDPTNLNIVNGGETNPTASTIDPSYIVSMLNGTNVVLSASNSLTVTNAINASGNASAGNLTLGAPTDFLNAPITLRSGSTLLGTATTVNVGANGLVQNGVDAAASGGTVNLAAATYDLSGEITINKNLTLNGDATSGSILNGNNASRVMEIDGTSDGITVDLNRLTLENGNGTGTNLSNYGGGLLLYTGNGNSATVTLNNSTLSGNTSVNEGGGIYAENDGNSNILNINNSTISGNNSDLAAGIAYEGQAGSGMLNINNSTIANNTSSFAVGAIYVDTFFNTTITLTNSTISGNAAGEYGGILSNAFGINAVSIKNSIISGNTANGSESDYAGLSPADNGHNLYGQNGNAGGFTGNGTTDILLAGNINTALGTLGNHGGLTQTMPLLVGSPAYLAGGARGLVTTDQRGDARGSIISIGAYDYVPASLVVNTTADAAGDIIGGATTSLRDALYYSNIGAISDPDITFAPNVFNNQQTITLEQGQLTIDSSLTLNGPTSGIILNGNNASRVMEIDGTPTGITVALSKLTFTGGNGMGGNNDGGAGGGLLVYGAYGNQATVSLNDSTISGNTAYYGGGILSTGQSGKATLNINDSTIAGNSSIGNGGAITNQGVAGSATLTIANSTISGNSTSGDGGGIINQNGGTLTIGDTILAANTADAAESNYFSDNAGAITDHGYNLFGQNGNSGGFSGSSTTDILLSGNISKVLGALGNNGGPTQTMALVTGSPAIDTGDPALTGSRDERGIVRGSLSANTGFAPDIGAYEAEFIPASPPVVTKALIFIPDSVLRASINSYTYPLAYITSISGKNQAPVYIEASLANALGLDAYDTTQWFSGVVAEGEPYADSWNGHP